MGAEQIGVRAYAGAMCKVRMGILGGGQLGRMLALAAHELGVQTRCWDQREDAVAGHVGGLHVDDFQKPERLDVFLRGVDVVTTEWENVPVALLEEIERRGVPVRPGSLALRVAQDRVLEKNLARSLGIPTPAFVAAVTLGELEGAVREVGLPCVVKTRRFGYDGKGQVVVRKAEEVAACWGALGATAGGLIVEGFVPFARELSIIAARGVDGQTRFYPLVCNEHAGGILRVSTSPVEGVSEGVRAQAEEYAGGVLGALEYVGVLAIELFEVGGELVFNEIAPRVHNSGHWTIDASATSQFENHVRAVLGLPLGDAGMVAPGVHAGMVNLIGSMPDAREVLRIAGAKLHDYAKEARAGRKLGHVNVLASSQVELMERIGQVRGLLR